MLTLSQHLPNAEDVVRLITLLVGELDQMLLSFGTGHTISLLKPGVGARGSRQGT